MGRSLNSRDSVDEAEFRLPSGENTEENLLILSTNALGKFSMGRYND